MLTEHQLRICVELVELYKAQLPFVAPNSHQGWTTTDLELFEKRAERISNLQSQLLSRSGESVVTLKTRRAVVGGSWQDR